MFWFKKKPVKVRLIMFPPVSEYDYIKVLTVEPIIKDYEFKKNKNNDYQIVINIEQKIV